MKCSINLESGPETWALKFRVIWLENLDVFRKYLAANARFRKAKHMSTLQYPSSTSLHSYTFRRHEKRDAFGPPKRHPKSAPYSQKVRVALFMTDFANISFFVWRRVMSCVP